MTQRLGRILVVGYTGETGKALLNALPLADTLDHATLCGRRDIDLPEALKSKATQTRLDFENVPMVGLQRKSIQKFKIISRTS